MKKKDEEHLAWLKNQFLERFDKKFRRGNKKYKESLLEKENNLEEAIQENLDQYAYLMSEWRRNQTSSPRYGRAGRSIRHR